MNQKISTSTPPSTSTASTPSSTGTSMAPALAPKKRKRQSAPAQRIESVKKGKAKVGMGELEDSVLSGGDESLDEEVEVETLRKAMAADVAAARAKSKQRPNRFHKGFEEDIKGQERVLGELIEGLEEKRSKEKEDFEGKVFKALTLGGLTSQSAVARRNLDATVSSPTFAVTSAKLDGGSVSFPSRPSPATHVIHCRLNEYLAHSHFLLATYDKLLSEQKQQAVAAESDAAVHTTAEKTSLDSARARHLIGLGLQVSTTNLHKSLGVSASKHADDPSKSRRSRGGEETKSTLRGESNSSDLEIWDAIIMSTRDKGGPEDIGREIHTDSANGRRSDNASGDFNEDKAGWVDVASGILKTVKRAVKTLPENDFDDAAAEEDIDEEYWSDESDESG